MVCTRCAVALPPGAGKCPNCGKWLTHHDPAGVHIVDLSEAKSAEEDRLLTGPWDRTFGGGIVTSSINLLGGEPGAGKSTLSLQIADSLAGLLEDDNPKEVASILYIAAEENVGQIKARAERLRLKLHNRIKVAPVLGAKVNLSAILESGRVHSPELVILDSLPGLIGPNDLGQALEVCSILKGYADRYKVPAILIDHINKAGDFAGLEALQHAVDATLLFTLEKTVVGKGTVDTRRLRARKNRHGAVGAATEVHFDMTGEGLTVLDLEHLRKMHAWETEEVTLRG